MFLLSCGEDDKETSVSQTEETLASKYCMGLTELDLSGDDVNFTFNGFDIVAEKTVDGNNFTLDGSINAGEGSTDIQIASAFSSTTTSGPITLTVGAPMNMTLNLYAKSGECETDEVDEDGIGVDELITANPLDETQIANISYFRSSAGHSSADSFEECRSMKHYFEPTDKVNDTNTIYAPFDGVVVSMYSEEGGDFDDDGLTNQQITIKPTLSSAYQVIFYHVDVESSLDLSPGDEIEAGTLIGHGRLVRVNSGETEEATSNDFDIKVEVLTSLGVRAVSVFQLMSDSVFGEYITEFTQLSLNPSELIHSKIERDTATLTCDGEKFSSGHGENDNLARWLVSD